MPQPVLVIVDVQDRLFTAMSADRRDTMIANVKILGGAARRLGVPIVLTEQYPKGLGRTLPELRALLGDLAPVEKTSFSCGAAGGFTERLRALGAERAVLCGMEAHVCVLLTALDLLAAGVAVTVAADAVCSRTVARLELGVAQARQAGAVVSATETIVFQWLGSSDHEAFREVSALLK